MTVSISYNYINLIYIKLDSVKVRIKMLKNVIYSECECHSQGSAGNVCDPRTGQCRCRGNNVGINCDECKPGSFGFPACRRKFAKINERYYILVNTSVSIYIS